MATVLSLCGGNSASCVEVLLWWLEMNRTSGYTHLCVVPFLSDSELGQWDISTGGMKAKT